VAARAAGFMALALGGYAVLMALIQVRLIPVYRQLPLLAIKKPPGATDYAIAVIALITVFVAWIAFRTVILAVRRQLFPRWPPGPGP
jgi:hypothetical protein